AHVAAATHRLRQRRVLPLLREPVVAADLRARRHHVVVHADHAATAAISSALTRIGVTACRYPGSSPVTSSGRFWFSPNPIVTCASPGRVIASSRYCGLSLTNIEDS